MSFFDFEKALSEQQDLPMCAKCGHPVERMEVQRRYWDCQTRFTVYCHGESETVDINEELIIIAGKGGIKVGVAFQNNRISQNHSSLM
jgi:hypothetical protein